MASVDPQDTAKRARLPGGLDATNILEDSRKRRRGSSADPESKDGFNSRRFVPEVPATDPAGFDEVRKKAVYLYDKLTSLRDLDGRYTHLEFLKLPSKIDYPDYYVQIKKPMCYAEIKKKIDKLEYSTISAVVEDFKQVFVNAKRYNAPGSAIFLDAKHLHKLLKDSSTVLTGNTFEIPEDDEEDEDFAPPVKRAHASASIQSNTSNGSKRGPTLKPWLTRKLSELTSLADSNGRKYSDGFQTLPDRNAWQEYYRIITHPMSLELIAGKVMKRTYQKLEQFVDEVNVTFDNALYFNEETSRIWKDAKVLKNHFAEIMKEVPPVFVPPRKYNTVKRRAEAEAIARAQSADPNFRASEGPQSPAYDNDSGGEDEYEASQSPGAIMDSYGSPMGQPSPALPFDLPLATDPFALPGRSRAGTPSLMNPNSNPYAPLVNQLPLALPSPAFTNGSSLPHPVAATLPPQPIALSSGTPPPATTASTMERSQSLGNPSVNSRPISKMPSEGEQPAISRFLVRTTPSTVSITLDNSLVRQHSFAIPQWTERVEFSPFFRRGTPTKGKGKAAMPEETLEGAPPLVKLNVRPSTTSIETLAELPGVEGPTLHYALTPKSGLTVVEILVTPRTGQAETEVYRIFLTK